MRTWTAIFAALLIALPVVRATEKLTEQDRIELVRGLLAEYATVKQLLPRAKKPLPFEADRNLRQETMGGRLRTNTARRAAWATWCISLGS